jgi:heterodisulfide reductase subunit C
MATPDTAGYQMSRKESELRAAFLREVDLIPDGHRIKQCIQCGTCTGSCPVSFAMDITPRKAVALFRAGEIESILRSNTIWICASCYACTVRCPAGIKITDMMYAFKRTAMEKKMYPSDLNVHTLSESFVRLVNSTGKNQEMGLLLRYGLRSNPFSLLKGLPLGLKLRSRGRLPLKTSRIRNRKQLSGIIRRVMHLNSTTKERSITSS